MTKNFGSAMLMLLLKALDSAWVHIFFIAYSLVAVYGAAMSAGKAGWQFNLFLGLLDLVLWTFNLIACLRRRRAKRVLLAYRQLLAVNLRELQNRQEIAA